MTGAIKKNGDNGQCAPIRQVHRVLRAVLKALLSCAIVLVAWLWLFWLPKNWPEFPGCRVKFNSVQDIDWGGHVRSRLKASYDHYGYHDVQIAEVFIAPWYRATRRRSATEDSQFQHTGGLDVPFEYRLADEDFTRRSSVTACGYLEIELPVRRKKP